MKKILLVLALAAVVTNANAVVGPDIDATKQLTIDGAADSGVTYRARNSGWVGVTDQRVAAIVSASKTAREAYEAAYRANTEALAALSERLAGTDDTVTKSLLKSAIKQRTALGETIDQWVRTATDLEGTHRSDEGGVYYMRSASGRYIGNDATLASASIEGIRNSQVTLMSQLADKLAEPGSINSVAGVDAATESLTRGQDATGSLLLLPGEKKGQDHIAIASGVVDRTTDSAGYETRILSLGSGEAGILEKTTGEEAEKASLVMIGDNVHATIGAGEAAILIGDNSKTEGNGIAIGKNATSTNNSIALGNDSVSTEPDELSIGNDDGLNRKITHMTDGTKDSDGATIHNVNEATGLLEKELTKSIGTSHDDAIEKAKKYTDDTTSDANDKVLRETTTYTDDTAKETLKTANEHTERRAVIAENNAVTRSNTYTDESSSRTLEKANTYTNHQVAQAENNAVTRSNDYTNKRFGELKHQVDRNEKRANGGIAGAMAMTAIPSVPGHDFSFGMATSGYRGQGAIAAGVKANITQNTTVSLNTAWDSGNGVGVAAGFSVGW
ncbi:hypothetical protein CIH63_05860 [Salmonella enterica]|nr:hypothetical protein [Salmonella enterica]